MSASRKGLGKARDLIQSRIGLSKSHRDDGPSSVMRSPIGTAEAIRQSRSSLSARSKTLLTSKSTAPGVPKSRIRAGPRSTKSSCATARTSAAEQRTGRYLGRLERVVRGEVDVQEKDTAAVRRVTLGGERAETKRRSRVAAKGQGGRARSGAEGKAKAGERKSAKKTRQRQRCNNVVAARRAAQSRKKAARQQHRRRHAHMPTSTPNRPAGRRGVRFRAKKADPAPCSGQ